MAGKPKVNVSMTFNISAEAAKQLEFDKIMDRVRDLCKGDPAKNSLDLQPCYSNLQDRKVALLEVKDYMALSGNGQDLYLRSYEDLTATLALLKKEGYVLDAESVLAISDVLKNYRDFVSIFDKDRKLQLENLFNAGRIEGYTENPLESITRVFDEEGNVRPDASPALVRIFKHIDSARRKADSLFDQILLRYRNMKMLGEPVETWRNSRRVLIVPSENKRKIGGVIHDQSASGKTFFIEPQEIIEINNEVFSLENEKRAELYRILSQLSGVLRTHSDLITEIFTTVRKIDLIRAKALFGISLDGIVPELTEESVLRLFGVCHPLLVIQQKEGGTKVVPFDLELKGTNKLLLISGPNAGGKSVTLKAVGLCHLMAYAGIPIPADARTVIGTFTGIFTDIGDQQSIDDGLSTYSSHLTNLNEIVSNCDENSLVLLDEIGSGTDPKLGGAIAEGVLRALIRLKANGVVTTHYSSLKVFAFKTRGILNGAMLFDKVHLEPTYILKVGKPGSSYAFEVARKTGMDPGIVRYARKKVGRKENAVEDLLIDLQHQRAVLEKELNQVKREKENLDQLIKNYQKLSDEFKVKRKKLQIRAKEIEVKKANDERLELNRLIKELEREKNIEAAKKAKEEAEQKRASKSIQIKVLKKEVYQEQEPSRPLKKGDFVRLLDGEMSGEVIEVKKDHVKVLFGLLQMDVPKSELVLARDQIEINREKRINLKGIAFDNNFSPKLDIRGYKIDDADRTLQEFLDRALMSNASTLEVIHGKGSGALRKLVQRKLKDYKDVQRSWHPAEEMGGEGVTFIKL